MRVLVTAGFIALMSGLTWVNGRAQTTGPVDQSTQATAFDDVYVGGAAEVTHAKSIQTVA